MGGTLESECFGPLGENSSSSFTLFSYFGHGGCFLTIGIVQFTGWFSFFFFFLKGFGMVYGVKWHGHWYEHGTDSTGFFPQVLLIDR
jgi:hypothetical protein